MDYSREQLLTFNRENLKPTRIVRKDIFRCGVWLPATARLRHIRGFPTTSIQRDPRDPDRAHGLANRPLACTSDSARRGCPTSRSRSREDLDQKRKQQQCDRPVSFGLLNARSLGNKYMTICSEVIDKGLQVCFLTETWHTSSTDTAIGRCVPPGFSLHDRPRPSDSTGQNHGGVAVILSDDMSFREIKSTVQPTTFESMFFALTHGSSTTIVLLIYRPGSVSQVPPEFYTELMSYLEAVVMYKCRTVICGDLNVHVEDGNDRDAGKLLDLLHSFDYEQRILGPTHTHGGTLDHIYTRSNDNILGLNVDPCGVISDHSFIDWRQPVVLCRLSAARETVRSGKR